MKVNIYTIYDSVAKECGPIFQAKNHDVAVRAFHSLMAETSNVMSTDYDLYCLGEFDTEKCSFVPLDVPSKISIVSDSDLDPNKYKDASLFEEAKE